MEFPCEWTGGLAVAAMEVIGSTRVVAVLRAERPDQLVAVADVLVSCGIRAVEFALTTPGALEALAVYCREAPPGSCVGAGTVLSAGAARAAIEVGAAYLVTPGFVPEVLDAAAAHGVPVLAGAYTASEVVAAHRAGAAAVKVFPAAIGGPRYIRLLRDPLPDVPLVPTGGISLSDAPDYLAAGALAVGLGGSLIGDALRGGPIADLARRATELVEALGTVRTP